MPLEFLKQPDCFSDGICIESVIKTIPSPLFAIVEMSRFRFVFSIIADSVGVVTACQ